MVDLFVVFANDDRSEVADALVGLLRDRGLRVWDDRRLALYGGERLLRAIDEALTHCRVGLVVITPAFLKLHWPAKELDAIAARCRAKQLMAVWHNVLERDVARFSERLSEVAGISSGVGLAEVAERVATILRE